MSRLPRSILKYVAERRGASLVELLAAIALTGMALGTATKYLMTTNQAVRRFDLLTEATINARAAVDTILRDVRLAGACLPVTGDFMSLDGTDSGDTDRIVTRTGLVRPDMSCVRATVTVEVTGSAIHVESSSGFTAGMRAYIRDDTSGEYFTISAVTTGILASSGGFTRTYAPGAGVYAIDERTYYIENRTTSRGITPQLMLQVGDDDPIPFAMGVEKLNFSYQLRRNCPPCDAAISQPSGDDEWRLVQEVRVEVVARSDRKGPDGTYAKRTMNLSVKPRNLLP